MTRKLAIAARTLEGVAPGDIIRIAAAAGFDAAGVLVDPAAWGAGDVRDVRAACAASGAFVLDVEAVRLFAEPPGDAARRVIAAGAEVGARAVLVIGHDADRARVIDSFRAVCKWAGEAGLRAALEFMPFRAVATLSDARAVVEGADHPAGAILVDNHHLARSGGTPGDLAAIPPDLLPYAQLCDAPAILAEPRSNEALMRDALHHRTIPGEGALPIKPFIAALPAGAPIAVEILGTPTRARFATDQAYARAIWHSVQPR